ncbi:energy transducer TonB [Aeromonas hydrophila]|uniref:energy transducer TonB n=1 Tax=Aeromonas hydrophila TaxID=644 RepID=UPI0020B3F6D6|nr:energy transducer TonB [Aeromonas hydrophila]MCP3289412.1 energy transducer TonB [Aeromonas hydrophila]HDX8385572.1 energy transducer TonB [Aeromonas hydrophila]
MDSCSPRPALPANDPDAARLVCLAIAIALHLAAFWWLYAHQPAPITPPLPLTLSARWVGEAATNDAPAKAAPAPAPAPTVQQVQKVPQKAKPLPTPKKPPAKPVKKSVKPVVKPLKHSPPPVQPAKVMPVSSPQPPVTAPAPATTATATQASGGSASQSPAHKAGGGAGNSAPIARDARLNNPEPQYPYESRRRGEEGRVILNVRVTAEGTAASVEVDKSSGYRRLDMTARKTVSRWKFIPAKQNNVAVEASAKVTIIFKLRA